MTDLRSWLRAGVLVVLVLAGASGARATADGPDAYRVAETAPAEGVALRAGPGETHALLGRIGPRDGGLANFGCRGRPSLAEWQAAGPEARTALRSRVWCRLGAGREIGWARGAHLVEAGAADGYAGGARLRDLSGTRWRFRETGAGEGGAIATLGFGPDGRVAGGTGCNRFAGAVAAGPGGTLAFGPLALTRMACPAPAATREAAILAALERVASAVATDGVLALFDAAGERVALLDRAEGG